MTQLRKIPPRVAGWIFARFGDSEEKSTISGDMEEYFHEMAKEEGPLKARLWFWRQVLFSVPALAKNSIYLIIALRNMKKSKGFAFINIAGLALGLAVFTLISLFIQFELSYDRCHKNIDRMSVAPLLSLRFWMRIFRRSKM